MLLALSVSISVGLASASVQTFDSDVGKIEINLPYTAELGGASQGFWLVLGIPGEDTRILDIVIVNATGPRDFRTFAENFSRPLDSRPLDSPLEEMNTIDGKPMLFNVHTVPHGYGNSTYNTYNFRGYIDYSKEKGKYIFIQAADEVGFVGEEQMRAPYTKDEFVAICQSFTIK